MFGNVAKKGVIKNECFESKFLHTLTGKQEVNKDMVHDICIPKIQHFHRKTIVRSHSRCLHP